MAQKETKNEEEVVTVKAEKLVVPVAIILVLVIVALVVVFGSKKSSESVDDNSAVEGTEDYSSYITSGITTNIDDDPYLGDKSTAKFAIVEFSDYFCPYCYRHTTEVLPELLSTYVETGKAIYVFRDLPVHGETAQQRAQIAKCVNEIAGAEKFYEFHKKVLESYSVEDLNVYDVADSLGINSTAVKKCYESGKYAQETEKDAQDANAIGISGTPGFVVGILGDDGSVSGSSIGGALPFEAFKSVVDGLNIK